MILENINSDLKKSMLAGDKSTVSALKNIKTAIQYAGVAKKGQLSEEEIIKILSKEAKKRGEAFSLYEKAGDMARAQAELDEKEIINRYLPEPLSEEDVAGLIDEAISEVGEVSGQTMGKIISLVKDKAGANADGGLIAKLVRNRINQ